MTYEIKNNRIYFYDAYSDHDLIKLIPGRRWHKGQKAWSVPYDEFTCIKIKNMLGIEIEPPQAPQFQEVDADDYDPMLSFLYRHQRQSAALFNTLDVSADLSDPGTGKTLVQIELILRHGYDRILIVCPKSIIYSVWVEQLQMVNKRSGYNPFDIVPLGGGTAKIKATLKEYRNYNKNKQLVFIINYESLRLVVDDVVGLGVDAVVLDESTRIKNRTAKRTKAVMKLKQAVRYRTIMTGTPAPNGLPDLWSQYFFLDERLLGSSFYAFRDRYMYPVSLGEDRRMWLPKPGAMDRVRARIAKISVQHRKRDCTDLPELVHEIREIEMPTEVKTAYESMKNNLLLELDGKVVTAQFVATKLMKLRQIASGFIYDGDGALKISDFKLKELDAVLDELDGQKVIVFAHFRESLRIIYEHLHNKMECVLFDGRLGDEAKREAVNRFRDRVRVFIANPMSAGHGLNLQFCSYIIYFEHDFSLEAYEQSVQRIERIGQKQKMTVFHLLAKNTLEPYILRKLREKININKALDIAELRKNL